MNGVLEFYDTVDSTCMSQAEHFMATDVEWDPTGRYVATSVSWWAHKVRRDSLAGNSLTSCLGGAVFSSHSKPINRSLYLPHFA